jgi:translation initiation factor 2A
MESWNIVLSGANFDILLKDVRVHASENQGWVTCLEVMDGEDSRGRLIATNVFEKQNGKWVIIHHHASPAPRP